MSGIFCFKSFRSGIHPPLLRLSYQSNDSPSWRLNKNTRSILIDIHVALRIYACVHGCNFRWQSLYYIQRSKYFLRGSSIVEMNLNSTLTKVYLIGFHAHFYYFY